MSEEMAGESRLDTVPPAVAHNACAMLALIAAALAVFSLAVAAVLTNNGSRRGFRRAMVAAVLFAAVGAGLGIVGTIRWRHCHRGGLTVDFRTAPGTHLGTYRNIEECPSATLGLRDPF
jgi:hypothetical protein